MAPQTGKRKAEADNGHESKKTKTSQNTYGPRECNFTDIITLADLHASIYPHLSVSDLRSVRRVNRKLFAATATGSPFVRRVCEERLQHAHPNWNPRSNNMLHDCPRKGQHSRIELFSCQGTVVTGTIRRNHRRELWNGDHPGFLLCQQCNHDVSARFDHDRTAQSRFVHPLCNNCILAVGPLATDLKMCTCAEDVSPPAEIFCRRHRIEAIDKFAQEAVVLSKAINRIEHVKKTGGVRWSKIDAATQSDPVPGDKGWRCPCGKAVKRFMSGYGVCPFCLGLICIGTARQLQVNGFDVPGMNCPLPPPKVNGTGTRRSPRNHAKTPACKPRLLLHYLRHFRLRRLLERFWTSSIADSNLWLNF